MREAQLKRSNAVLLRMSREAVGKPLTDHGWRTELNCCMDDRDSRAHQLEKALADYQRLKEENAALRRLLADNGIKIPLTTNGSSSPVRADGHEAGVNEHSAKNVKVVLFRGLFRGREDVYAVRTRFRNG